LFTHCARVNKSGQVVHTCALLSLIVKTHVHVWPTVGKLFTHCALLSIIVKTHVHVWTKEGKLFTHCELLSQFANKLSHSGQVVHTLCTCEQKWASCSHMCTFVTYCENSRARVANSGQVVHTLLWTTCTWHILLFTFVHTCTHRHTHVISNSKSVFSIRHSPLRSEKTVFFLSCVLFFLQTQMPITSYFLSNLRIVKVVHTHAHTCVHWRMHNSYHKQRVSVSR